MNHRATAPRPAAGALLILLLSIFVAACQNRSEPERGGIAGSSIGGPFSLIDQDGRRVRDTDYNGRYRMMYFGFANCPDICPVDLATMGAGLRRFEEQDAERAGRVQPIFITVDPARDTPAILKTYVANFHRRLIGLTGSEQDIAAVKREYGIYGEKMEPTTPGAAYNMSHSRYILLFGPAGEPIAMVPHENGAEGVAAELDKFVR